MPARKKKLISAPDPMRPTIVQTKEEVAISQRISIGLVALSLGLISLALAASFFSAAGPAALIAPSTISTGSSSAQSSATAVTLNWTAPGDDGQIGQATSYDLRFATSAITNGTFNSATAVTATPAPQPAGSTESLTVTNLQPATTYFFALKSTDDAGNVSDISNIAVTTTATLLQACVPVYQCTAWSACTNGQQTRTCSVTNACVSNLDQPLTTQSCTTPVVTLPPADTTSPPPITTPPSRGGGPVQIQKHIIVAGVGPKTIPVVRVVNAATQAVEREWLAFSRTNTTGTNVAAGDVDGDHLANVIVGTGAGSDPDVKVFTDSGVLLGEFNPYPTSRGIGVEVAAGDVDGDGVDEILTIPAKSASQLRIFDYVPATKSFTALAQTFIYDRSQTQGFTVAAGDLNLDGRADIVIAPRANGQSVTVLSYTTSRTIQKIKQFSPFGRLFKSGLTVATGDTDGNGRGEILVTPGPGYFSHIKVFDVNGQLQSDFQPARAAYFGGIDLTALDVNTDGRDEILTGAYGPGDPLVNIWRYSSLSKTFSKIQSYYIFPRTMKSGIRLGSR